MPRTLSRLLVTACCLAVAGCSREAIRDMGSLKDDHREAEIVRAARTATAAGESRARTEAAVAGATDEADAPKQIETGSLPEANCQGEHLAYQATREYLKNFGPKPPAEPGERGPCRRGD